MPNLHQKLSVILQSQAEENRVALSGDVAQRLATAALNVVWRDITLLLRPRRPSIPSDGGLAESPQVPLTRRQEEILTLLIQGKSTSEISEALGLAIGTIKVHKAALYRTLNVRDRLGAVLKGAALLALPLNQRASKANDQNSARQDSSAGDGNLRS